MDREEYEKIRRELQADLEKESKLRDQIKNARKKEISIEEQKNSCINAYIYTKENGLKVSNLMPKKD